MKRKRDEQAERRRPVVEPNLAAHSAGRSTVGRKGCASLLSRGLLLMVAVLVVAIGLR